MMVETGLLLLFDVRLVISDECSTGL